MELNIFPQYKQDLAYQAWDNDDVDDVVFGGFAGGGKTWWGSEAIMRDALMWPDTRYFIGRKDLKSVMESSFVTLTQKVLPFYKLEQGKHWEFNGQRYELKFYNDSVIKFLHTDLIPSDPMFDRFGSQEFTRGWGDEVSEWPFKAYDVLKSRVGRWKNAEYNIKSKMALTLNPSQDWPYRVFYTPWKKAGRPIDPRKPLVSIRTVVDGETHERTFVFIPAKPGDNEFTAKEYLRQLATITDPVLKARLMEGDWEFTSAMDILFPADAIADMFDNPAKKSAELFMTVDVARSADDIVLTYWKGWDAFRIELIHTAGNLVPITDTASRIRTGLTKYGIPREHVLVDQDGVGGGLFDLLPGVIGFSGGAAPFGVIGEMENRERYENLKAQCVYHAAQKARDRQMSISEENLEVREQLAADLPQFKRRDADRDGKLKITQKQDIRMALGRSPDIGDTIIMRSYFDLRVREEAIARGGDGKMHVFIPDP
jgi:phage terminase large subunit